MIEKRFIISELRLLEENSRTIKGTAIVFNSLSEDLGGFKEIIVPESITQEFLDSCDIVMLYNHEEDQGVLARSKKGNGSLKVSVDEIGVHFSFDAKNTSLGNEVLESVRNGDLDSCSFAFIVKEDKIERIDGMLIRTILSFNDICDLSVVVHPAYEATTVDIRRIELIKANEIKEIEERERKKNEMIEYYDQLDKILYNIKN